MNCSQQDIFGRRLAAVLNLCKRTHLTTQISSTKEIHSFTWSTNGQLCATRCRYIRQGKRQDTSSSGRPERYGIDGLKKRKPRVHEGKDTSTSVRPERYGIDGLKRRKLRMHEQGKSLTFLRNHEQVYQAFVFSSLPNHPTLNQWLGSKAMLF